MTVDFYLNIFFNEDSKGMCKSEGCNIKVRGDKYGGFCNKHKSNYLIYDGIIIYDRFTKKNSDYRKGDIIKTLNILYKDNGWNKIKKEYLLNILKDYYLEENIPSIVKFTRNFMNEKNICSLKRIQKNYNNKKRILLKGEGFKDRSKCNNDTDFFTYDSIYDIEDKYFFSYKDNSDFIWFYDIRSFNKLIEMGQNNPYTREEIPEYVKERANKLSKILGLTKEDDLLNAENIRLNRQQSIKQKTIDIFSQMEQFGYGCNIEWFLQLHTRKIKSLYRYLEDIWNYRLNLSYETKARISPPNGMAFNIPIVEVNSITSSLQLKELILNEVFKFNNAITEEDKKLGFMYFLLGLGLVSKECYESHQWIIHAVY